MKNLRVLVAGPADGLTATMGKCLPDAELLIAPRGEPAFELAMTHDPDVILIAGGSEEALETCRKFKTSERLQHIPVVFITNETTGPDARVRALQCGADAFAPKAADGLELAALTRSMAKIKQRNTHPGGGEGGFPSDETYRQMFEAESDALFVIETETGRILRANRAAAERYGYAAEELLSMTTVDLSAEPERTAKAVRHSPPGNYFIPFRLHRKRDGTVFPVEIAGRVFSLGGRLVHAAAVRDIEARTRAASAPGK